MMSSGKHIYKNPQIRSKKGSVLEKGLYHKHKALQERILYIECYDLLFLSPCLQYLSVYLSGLLINISL